MTENTIFYNADYIVIEYMDIIKSPYLILLHYIRKNPKLRDILKIETIQDLDDASLYEWYINRKHMNFFIDLNRYPDKISNEQLDDLLNDQIGLSPIFCKTAEPLVIKDMLKVLTKKKLSNDVIIYYPHDDDFAEKDLNSLGIDYTFMKNFDEVMAIAKQNSTYFLSDINKITRLKEKGYLRYSSITLPLEYRYNKKNMKDYKLDFNELLKDDIFKLSFMRACSYEK